MKSIRAKHEQTDGMDTKDSKSVLYIYRTEINNQVDIYTRANIYI